MSDTSESDNENQEVEIFKSQKGGLLLGHQGYIYNKNRQVL